jgi:hypothetical protein
VPTTAYTARKHDDQVYTPLVRLRMHTLILQHLREGKAFQGERQQRRSRRRGKGEPAEE